MVGMPQLMNSIPGQKLVSKAIHSNVNFIPELHVELQQFIDLEPTSLLNKSPCERTYSMPVPLTSNLTISCCKKCAGKEIKLI